MQRNANGQRSRAAMVKSISTRLEALEKVIRPGAIRKFLVIIGLDGSRHETPTWYEVGSGAIEAVEIGGINVEVDI